jgi:hypothetical protein
MFHAHANSALGIDLPAWAGKPVNVPNIEQLITSMP